MNCRIADFQQRYYPDFITFYPITERAKQRIPPNAKMYGGGMRIEQQYAADVLWALDGEGFSILESSGPRAEETDRLNKLKGDKE